ncbi:MAG: helix-turn-helix transcriptional regulator [Desulfuromonadaceae bacterium]|nr:helix-turn-helix transcriptional regulator [Desulfuromonadaceae bacterium]MDD2856729.1 helix-turn-helix transcriptional regulator [Desulfuromonadaceae bacterium]
MLSDNFKDRLKKVMGSGSNSSFARKCEISESAVRNYLKGQTTPDLGTLAKIAEVSGYSLAWLASGEGPMKGFTAVPEAERKAIDSDKPAVYLDVIEDVFEEITRIFDRKVGNRRAEISSDKSVTLVMLLARIYSKNFLESAEFRRNTLEKNVEALVKLALPEE